MKHPATLVLVLAMLISIAGCDNEDDNEGATQTDVYGLWEADSSVAGTLEQQDISIEITEDRILVKIGRTINPATAEILSTDDYVCLGYGDLGVDDPAAGVFTVHAVENLSYPSQGAENISIELSDDRQSMSVTTEIPGWDGSRYLAAYELVKASSESDIDETSCTSQELQQ